MQYTIEKPIIQNGDIIGYEVIDPDGNEKKYKYKDVIQLVEKSETNCKIVAGSDKKHIYFTSLPIEREQTKYTIVSRTVKGNKLLGYVCREDNGNIVKMTPNRLWKAAAQGRVHGVKAKTSGKKLVLIGEDFKFSELTVVKL